MSENSKSVPSTATKQQLLFPDDNRKTEKKSVERQPQHDAIQKRKNTFKAIKPTNSLKNSSEIDGELFSLYHFSPHPYHLFSFHHIQ